MVEDKVVIAVIEVDCVEGRVVESVPLLGSIDIETEDDEVDGVMTGGL